MLYIRNLHCLRKFSAESYFVKIYVGRFKAVEQKFHNIADLDQVGTVKLKIFRESRDLISCEVEIENARTRLGLGLGLKLTFIEVVNRDHNFARNLFSVPA